MKKVYMDHAGTTPVDTKVFEAMRPFFSDKYGNASSLHSYGQEAAEVLERSRETIAKALNCNKNEIIFTSGGTEADNLALKGTAFANKEKGKHIITSQIEHHAVLDTCKWLERNGFSVTYLPVDKYGLVKAEDLKKSIRKDTVLVSVMYANNEVGTVEPIKELSRICNERNIYFHTDAVQAFGKIPINIENVNMLSMSSHKLYGPKGVGALFIRDGTRIDPIMHGGGQENKFRSGTENLAGIVGFSKAVELAFSDMDEESKRLAKLRDKMINEVLEIENSFLNGHPVKRLPNNANFWFKFIEGESLVLSLDDKGIAASTGSACSSKSLEPSHVLLAIGLKHEEAHGSLRLTLGRQNSEDDVDYLLRVLPDCIAKLRKISPFKKSFETD